MRGAPDRVRVDPARGRDHFGRERLGQTAHLGERGGIDVLRDRPEIHEAVREEHVEQREQEERVGGRPDRQVFVGLFRGLRAARVDDHEPAAAGAQRAQSPGHVGRGHQRAVGRERVRAEHQEVVGAVDVGNGDRERAAEHESGGNLLRHLVDGARRVDVLRARGL